MLISVIFLFMLVLSAVQIFRSIRTDDAEWVNRPIFHRREQIWIAYIAFASIATPFIVQPIMDWAIFPTLDYEFCEALSSRSTTFGFPTYAYVPDPNDCPAR